MKARHLAARKSIRHRNNNCLMELFVYDKSKKNIPNNYYCIATFIEQLPSSQSKKSTIYGCREINEPNQL